MTLLKILKVKDVEGDYSALDKSPTASPEVHAYGVFSKIDKDSEIGSFARLRQESPLFSLPAQLGIYIRNNRLEEEVSAVVDKGDKDYISGEDKINFIGKKDLTKLFSANVDTLNYPQYAIMKRFNENLKKE
jgi:hypothetical protein